MGEVIIKTDYFPPVYDTGNKFKVLNRDVLIASILDEDTGSRRLEIIPEPEISFFVTKNYEYTYPQISINRDEVYEVRCKYNKRKFELAKAIDKGTEYTSMKQQPYERFSEWYRKTIQNSPYLYQADTDIEDFYKINFAKNHPRLVNKNLPLKKSYLDIEVDQKNCKTMAKGDNPIAPVNLITYYTAWDNTMYAFCLIDGLEDLPEYQYLRNHTEEFKRDYLTSKYGFDDNTTHNIWFYKGEEALFTAFWNILHKTKPDFCGIWNIAFDIPYLLRRAAMLNMDVGTLVCSPEIPNEFKRVQYREDYARKQNPFVDKNKKHTALMWDWAAIAGYTQFYDAMALYANLRKRYMRDGYKLDEVAFDEIGERKIALSDKEINIRTAAYDDYITFIQYGIKDTYILHLLEKKNEDLDQYIMATGVSRLEKGVNISIVLKNMLMTLFEEKNEVIGNNVLYDIWESVSGALVASPQLLDLAGIQVFKRATLIYDHVIDLDFSSLYPNIMITFNIGKNTIEFRILKITRENSEIPIGSGEHFIKLLTSRRVSIFELGNVYFNLPNIEEMIDILDSVA